MHQLFIVTSLQLLLPVKQAILFFGAEIFNLQEKKSAKIKCLLLRQKPQKFHTAEITGYTVFSRDFTGKNVYILTKLIIHLIAEISLVSQS